MWNLSFHDSFVFRSPAYPFSKGILSEDELKKLAMDEKFSEAIYISSPALYNEMQRWLKEELKNEKDKRKLIYSLSKYLSRIRTRCTPYGLFAGCSTGKWGEKNEIQLPTQLRSHTRLDMDFVCILVERLSDHSSIKPWLLFYPNNSIYPMGDELRYVEYKYVKENRQYFLKNIDKTEYVLKILESAKKGKRLKDLEGLLVSDEISVEESAAFIDEMVKGQLLISELEPAVTGEEFMAPLIRSLRKIQKNHTDKELDKILRLLKDSNERINLIDENNVNHIVDYVELLNVLKELNIPVKEKTVLQADAYYEPSVSILDSALQKKIIKVIEFQRKLSQSFQNSDLVSFRNKFYEVYEEMEIPLLEALDKESGIGYPNKDSTGVNPLVEEFIPAQANGGTQTNSSQRDQFLFKKLVDSFKTEKDVVVFKDEDLTGFQDDQLSITTATIGIMFKLIDAKKGKILLPFIGGNSSAANLLGRFAHGEKKIQNIIEDISKYEKEVMEDKIIAEIVHLPQSRIGNIVLRPFFRDYEIPYLGKSALPNEFQIPLEDIMVSVKNNRIVLRSKRLNKEILPRLSTAHYYGSAMSLPAYKFLGEMQLQDVNMPAISFNWGGLSNTFKFLPRAEYDDIILAPATWNFIKADYDILMKNIDSPQFLHEVRVWRKKWKMPRYIMLKDSDNELFVDMESELSVKTLLDTVKKRNNIEIVEFLFNIDSAMVHDEKGNPFSNEIIAILFNNDYKKKAAGDIITQNHTGAKIKDKAVKANVIRTFPLGSEWLFYKLYCGIKSADKILIKAIKPLVEELTGKGLIEKWFFIRYNDPDFHVRLRFYNPDKNKIGEIIRIACHYFNPLMEQRIISKILNDTYVRELERYGSNSIELSEEYFTLESSIFLNLLPSIVRENAEDVKLFYALRSVDDLLDGFHFTPGQKLGYMEILKNNFTNEHGGHKELKLRLDEKYRELRKDIENTLTKKKDNEPAYFSVVNLLNWKKQKLVSLANNITKLHEKRHLETSLSNLLSSYLHMNMNRIFMGKQRTYEMVIYDMLYRYYKSIIARESKTKKITMAERIEIIE